MTGAIRKIALAAVAAPLTLALAACGSSEDASGSNGGLSGEPIAAVAAPEGQSWSQMIEKTEAGGYRMGNPDAPIKIIEFASLTCPHCATFSENSSADLKGKFVESGRVSFEFRNFILNPLDLAMAMMVRCGPPESFFALTEQTFAAQPQIIQAWSGAGEQAAMQAAEQPPETRYAAIAQVAGLPEFYAARGIAADQARTCLADPSAAEALVNQTTAASEDFDVTGTPTFVINGQKADGNTWDQIRTRLENMGAR